MSPSRPAISRTEDGLPALSAWHAGWAVAAALLALVGPWIGAGVEGSASAALLIMVVPGVAGLALLFRDGWRERAMVLSVWSIAALIVAGLSGGLTGPLAGFVFLPLAAGLALGGQRLAQAGTLGVALAALVGLLSVALGGVGADAPYLAALTAILAAAATAWAMRLSLGPRERRLDTTETALAEAKDALDAQPGLTLILDSEGRVLAAHGLAPTSLTIDTLLNDGLIAAVHAPDRPAVIAAIERATSDTSTEHMFAPRLALDRRVLLVLRAMADGSGRRVAQVLDATTRHAREIGLDAARIEAETQNMGKTRFLANMSHELRTPLNAVIGFSDIMRQRLFGPLPDRYGDYADAIHEAGGHLLDLINDVLDVSKIEAERYELSIERFDAREVVSAAVALLRIQAIERGVILAAVLPGEPIPVDADKRALKQITLNLLSNALKFTHAEGSVTLTLEAIRPDLELTVADTGVGIAPEDLSRLGRPFEQAGAADQRAQGTGLGLSLTRSLAELHGGQMSIESTLGEGTAVTVRLPVVTQARAPIPDGGAEIIALNATG